MLIVYSSLVQIVYLIWLFMCVLLIEKGIDYDRPAWIHYI